MNDPDYKQLAKEARMWRYFENSINGTAAMGLKLADAIDALLSELDSTRERVAKLEAALDADEQFIVRVKLSNEICRCAPSYECLRCTATQLLETKP